MKKLTAAQRAILLTAGQAFSNASWLMISGQAALSHDRELEAEVTVDVQEDKDAWDYLTAIQEMLNNFGNDLIGRALSE